MTKTSHHKNHDDNNRSDVFLQRIPDEIYQKAISLFSSEYHFQNAKKRRLANYFVGIRSQLANDFIHFINEITAKFEGGYFPKRNLPEGFASHPDTLIDFEKKGGFSFGTFDMAITENGLRVIELQAVPTHPFTSLKLSSLIKQEMNLQNAWVFPNNKEATSEDFISTYQNIMGGKNKTPIVILERGFKPQKMNREFYATQKELGIPVTIVDSLDVFEKDQSLFYKTESNDIQKIQRIYNRILPSEAIYEDHYPFSEKYSFRYDKSYQNLKFINHPRRRFEMSKRLLPYIDHPFNPPALELDSAASQFLDGTLPYSDYVWKHKEGAAGFRLILSPTTTILKQLMQKNTLSDYIVQKKVNYKIFKTEDGLEKIVELRFMTTHTEEGISVVPMAIIGHRIEQEDGTMVYKIHPRHNNRLGYGISPVLIFNSK